MTSVYFDTSVFLAILNAEPSAGAIRQLLGELKSDRVRIYTSIITVQEVSVLAYRRGSAAIDPHVTVSRLARIETITRDIALMAAKYEALIVDAAHIKDHIENRRRKWDCFHLATAVALGCKTFYALDEGFAKRKEQLNLAIDVRSPEPTKPRFSFMAEPPS